MSPITADFFGFMEDEAMFHIGAAYINREHDFLLRPCYKPSPVVCSHLTRGVRVIRERLSRGIVVDNATLLAILFLPFCEVSQYLIWETTSIYSLDHRLPNLNASVRLGYIGLHLSSYWRLNGSKKTLIRPLVVNISIMSPSCKLVLTQTLSCLIQK